MANSVTDIYNLALSSIGARSDVNDPNERFPGALECSKWYETVLGAVFRAAPWPSASAVARLAKVAEANGESWNPALPPPAWQYEFAMPGDSVRPRYLQSFARFELSMRNATHVLLTNDPAPILYYTKRQPLVTAWDDQLTMAIVHALGAYVCIKLTGKTSRANRTLEVANGLIEQARQSAANEVDHMQYDFTPSWFAARGVTTPQITSQYYYPNGNLLSLPS